MSNAVYHRAYDEREPIEVRVENDRIEIVSFPGPDRSVTIEGLKSYRVSNRRYRNRRIGDFLKELHLTEGRNTGFKKILDALEANGSPKPEFETDDDRSYFITRLFIHEEFLKEEYTAEGVSNPNKPLTVNERIMSELVSGKNKESIQEILDYLKSNDNITTRKGVEITGKSTAQVRRYLKALCDMGVISSTKATKGNVYIKL